MPGEHSANQEDYSGDGYKKLKTALSFILSAAVFLIVRFISENIYAIEPILRRISVNDGFIGIFDIFVTVYDGS